MEKRVCPICKSSDSISVVKSRNNASDLDLQQLSDYFVGLRANQSFFEYRRCIKCQLLYAPEYFSENELSSLYEHMPPNLVGDDLDVVEKTHTGYAKFISKRVKKADSLIEVGADLGLVTGPVVKNCGITRGTLIEPNQDVHAQLSNSVGENPAFEVVNYLQDAKQSEKYDVCIAVHVIDHLLNPLEDLIDIRKKMTLGGQIFIVVHNQRSLLAKLMGHRWPPYCLQHPQIFDPLSIAELLKHSGFSNIAVARTTNWLGLKHSLTTILSLLRVPSKMFNWVPNVALPIKLGNMIVSAYAE